MEELANSSIWASLNSWLTSTVLFILLNLMIATILFTSNLPNNSNNQHQQQNHQEQQEEQEQKQNSDNHQNPPQIARSPSILNRLKSFNFSPQRSEHESSPDTHNHNPDPLQVAATQYVFNQPLLYQHFDFDPTQHFDPTREEIGSTTRFDFDSTRDEISSHTTCDFDPTRKESGKDTGFGFDPTQEEIGGDTGFDFDPTVEEEQRDEFESLDEVYSKLKGGGGGHDRTMSAGELPPKPPAKMKKSESLKVGFWHIEKEEIVEARRPVTVRERKTAVRVMEKDEVENDDVEVDARADDFINRFKNDLKLQRIESIIRTKGGKK